MPHSKSSRDSWGTDRYPALKNVSKLTMCPSKSKSVFAESVAHDRILWNRKHSKEVSSLKQIFSKILHQGYSLSKSCQCSSFIRQK